MGGFAARYFGYNAMLRLFEKLIFWLMHRNAWNRIRQVVGEFKDYNRNIRLKAPPLRIELSPSADIAWLDDPKAHPVNDLLTQSGFQRAGVFCVKGKEKVVLAGFVAPEKGAIAIISKGSDGVSLSFESRYLDGSLYECTSTPARIEPALPEWISRERLIGATPSEVWTRFNAGRPVKQMIPVTPESFVHLNTEAYSRYQAWMADRGGSTREELAARLQATGKLPAGSERESLLAVARRNEIEKALCNWWRLQATAPASLETIVDTLAIIYDEMDRDLVVNAYWCATSDFKVKIADFGEGSPRAAFAGVVARRGARLEKVLEKRTPLEADYYLPTKFGK